MERLFRTLHGTAAQTLQDFHWNAVQKLKQEIQTMEHLVTTLQGTTAPKLQKIEWNVVLNSKQETQTIEPLLQKSAWKNSTETAKLLLEHSVEARDANNGTPFNYAARNNCTLTAKLLLECGTEIETRNVNNRTPTHEAA